jgi:trans-aconitate methyltransferase
VEGDAHDPFGEGAFDAVFSNAALHWMRDPPRSWDTSAAR